MFTIEDNNKIITNSTNINLSQTNNQRTTFQDKIQLVCINYLCFIPHLQNNNHLS